jgi:hypothetical protein
MSQRNSGYERKDADSYETPAWVTQALLPHLPRFMELPLVWEPAAGSGKMLPVLAEIPAFVVGTDIAEGVDFLEAEAPPACAAIITNPPYNLAQPFIERALRLMEPCGGLVAMLLRTDYDHARSRQHLFRDCPAYAKKVVLTRRITWFEPEPGQKGKSPSFNHAWFIWSWQFEGPPTIAYGP